MQRTSNPLPFLAVCALVGGGSAFAQHYEDDKLTAFDAGAYDDFGAAVAILDDVAIVGAYGDDASGGIDSGSAYIYRQNGSAWSFEQKIEAGDAAGADYFGYAVELHDDMAIVGALKQPAGAVYVFQYNDVSQVWNQIQKIVPPDGAQGDAFGAAIDADGRYMAIGARYDADVVSDAGSVYMYEWEDSINQWVYLSEFRAHDPAFNDRFGEELAIDGDYVVVGVPYADPLGTSSGAAYIFKRNIGTWIEQIKIVPADGGAGYLFGSGVGISGDTVIIGSQEDWPGALRCGSAYVYRGSNMSWPLEQKIFDASTAASHWDRFGSAVDVVGDVALIGAEDSDAHSADSGGAYLYTRNGSTWTMHDPMYFGFDGTAFDDLGDAVDLDHGGDAAILGAMGDAGAGTNTGAAYVFNHVRFELDVEPDPLLAGSMGTFTVTNGQPSTWTFLAYSTRGLRKTYVGSLNVTIDLRGAKQAGNKKLSDVNGTAVWALPIPANMSGKSLWLQAVQYEWKTNVVATSIL